MDIVLQIKKLHENAVIPKYAKAGDAGLDLVAVAKEWDSENDCWSYKTGLAFEIPYGYVGLIFPRSSIYKYDLSLSNSVGVVDAGYRGEVSFKFKRNGPNAGYVYNVGDKVGQLVIVQLPKVTIAVVDELSTSERGTGGFGSSGT